MPRRSAGRSTRPAPRPRPRPQAPVHYPPQTVNHAPPPVVHSKDGPSMLGTMFQGMAFGTGSAIAHRIMGPRTIQHEVVASEAAPAPAPAAPTSMGGSEACGMQTKAFLDCLNGNGSDISKCQFYMDMLADCKRNSGSMMS